MTKKSSSPPSSSSPPVVLIPTSKFAVFGVPGEAGTSTASRSVVVSQPKSPSTQQAATASAATKPSQPKEVTKQMTPALEWTDSLQQDYDRILSVGEECVTVTELKDLLLRKTNNTTTSDDPIILYDGFEPSGRMHIAQGIFKAVNVNKCTAYFQTPNVAAKFVFWVADWFALMNDKMGGSLDKIQVVGDYLQQVWKAAGMQLEYVQFILASDAITQQAHIYWPLMLDVARRFTISRIKKCCQIMGRLEGNLSSAQMLYPLMQCTDVFFLQADICQLGVDQRKVNMLARDYFEAAKNDNVDKNKKTTRPKLKRPIILSHHMLYGLQKGQAKMSKSNPDSAIFMEDTRDDVERKINLAFCPTQPEEEVADEAKVDEHGVPFDPSSPLYNGQVLKNPCLDYIQNILFSQINYTFAAGGKNYDNYVQVQQDFCSGVLSVEDIKKGLITAVNDLLEPVRNHFATDPSAKEVLQQVQTFAQEMKAAAAAGTTDKKRVILRANWIELGAITGPPKPSRIDHVVVAPLPNLQPTLQEAMSVLQQLRHAAAATKSQNQSEDPPSLVLLLTDWSARVVNACTGDEAMIAAYYDILLATLRGLDGDDGVLKYTTVIYQSQAILLDPSSYWVSVINVGRHFSLQDVMGKASIQDDSTVGWVIARLLLVADLFSLAPTSTWSMNFSFRNPEQEEAEVDGLVTRFWQEQNLETELGFPCPQLVSSSITNTSLRLQAPRSDGVINETDEYYILDDPKVHGKSKMKKAFCEPGNIDFCPPIIICSAFVFSKVLPSGSLLVQRSEENGGNVNYTSREDLERDFGSGALHPGDLKASASNVMVEILDIVSKALQQDKAKNAVKAVKAFAKKNAKKGKK